MIEELDKLPSDVRPSDRVIKLKKYQDGFIFSERRFPAMVSAWGTGKTMSAIERARLHCENIPNNLGMIVRKEFTNLRDSTVIDFQNYLGVKIDANRNYKFPNGSMIMFRHGEELSKDNLSNINLGFFIIEQAEEFESDDVFQMLRGRLRRERCKHWGSVIANTRGHNWIYSLWKLNTTKDQEFCLYEATSFDNADILPKDTIEDWKKLKDQKSEVFERFVMNSWDIADDVFVVIPQTYVNEAIDRKFINEIQFQNSLKKRFTVCDIAGESEDSDETVIYDFEDLKLVNQEIYSHRNEMDTIGRLMAHGQKNQSKMITVDVVGMGSPVVGRLRELYVDTDMQINGFDSRLTEIMNENDRKTYHNYRAKAWFNALEVFKDKRISIPNDEVLKNQLSSVKFRYLSGKLAIEKKEETKKRIGGMSPDRADTIVMAIDTFNKLQLPTLRESQNKNVGWVHPRYRSNQKEYEKTYNREVLVGW
jgi:hypothetical protein